MQTIYTIDYGLPFVPDVVKKKKPVILMEINNKVRYTCISVEGGREIVAQGATPIEAMQNWEKNFSNHHIYVGKGDVHYYFAVIYWTCLIKLVIFALF